MWRVMGIVEDMGRSLSAAASLLEDVLQAMDDEMRSLQVHLDTDAAALRTIVENASLSDGDRADLLLATDRIEATARRVAAFAHPPEELFGKS